MVGSRKTWFWITPKTCAMFDEGTQVNLVLGKGPQALRMPSTNRD